jgi:N-carbamoylputrescine amidase
MPSPRFTIGLVQQAVSEDAGANLAVAEKAVRLAASRGARVVCLQELFNAPYFCKAQSAERFGLAEPIPGPTVGSMQKLASELEVAIVVPIFERRAAGLYHNSAAVVDADGSLLGVYRKMHIPDDPLYYEKYYFTPGDVGDHGEAPGAAEADSEAARQPRGAQPGADGNGARATAVRGASGFRVFQTRYAAIGVLICWDQWYPEAARITSLLGAQVLFYPTAIGWHPSEKETFGEAQADAWRTIQRAHAIANGVYVAAPNRVGFEPEPGTDGVEFFGRSFVSDPFGRIITEAEGEPTVLVATCDPALIEDTRRNWPFLRDRRIDAYGPILSRYLG